MNNKRLVEIFLLQIIVYLAIWLFNTAAALFLSIVFPCIFLSILLISIVADKIEPSKVPQWYFKLLGAMLFAPLLVAAIWYLFIGVSTS